MPESKQTKIEFNDTSVACWEDGDLAWVEDASTVAAALFGQRSTPAGLLPMAVRWIGPGGRIWVWERPPSKLKCLYNDKSYKVQLPWVVFVVDVVDGGVWAFARPGPIGSLEDQLYHLPLPGISKEGKLPVVRIKVGYSAEVIIQQAMQRFQEQFWAGEVPLDWQPEEIRTGDTTKMLTTWSEGDAVDVVNWGWIPRLTLGELANRHDASGRASCESLREFLEQAIRQ